MIEKEALKQKFSSEYKRYYEMDIFRKQGFERRKCINCGTYFWTLDSDRKTCPQQPCQYYEFLGDPPTTKKLDYLETWKQIEDFFVKRSHTSVKRYPVVCRWRPDLFFTVASVINFQRIEGGKVVFELPANPLIVPQVCMRFNDIPNVGVSGKHFTSFCMVGQHSMANSEGYWKDQCISLDYELLTGPFAIKPEEIVFAEDVWVGYGAFGYSLEYYVRGLELGNAVFTEFEGSPKNHTEMEEKVVDMGAGLERFTWITQGTPTSYDCVFGPVVEKMIQNCRVDYDRDFFLRYAKIAGALDLNEVVDIQKAKDNVATRLAVSREELANKTEPLEAIYALADHSKSLVFAIADGGLPSNVGGGYNLRVILRRALDLLYRFGWDLRLIEIAQWQIDYLKRMYPELKEHYEEVMKILEVEEKRYQTAKGRAGKIIRNLGNTTKRLTEDDLIQLYDSDGITPEFLVSQGLPVTIPPDFYIKVASRHITQKQEEEAARFDIQGLHKTRLLFYEDQSIHEFHAKVIKIFSGKYVALDQTSFYPRSGGQEPDRGFIENNKVVDVEKYGNIVLHKVEECSVFEGQDVRCKIDQYRRGILMRHHTATHVVNGAARRVLGSWVWQHSAFKGVSGARLDVTHYAHLTREDLLKIEHLANQVILKNIQVTKEVLKRSEAEHKYGFRIYQGGVVPGTDIRIICIPEWDIEACGGIHCNYTGEIGLIKILKSERVQDGIERIEFAAGETALKYLQQQENTIIEIKRHLNVQEEKVIEAVDNLKAQYENLKREKKALIRKAAQLESKRIPDSAVEVKGLKVYVTSEEGLDEEYHIGAGEKATEANPNLVYCAFIARNESVRTLVFCGSKATAIGVKAGTLAKELAKILGGSGGGDNRFGQGGGNLQENIAAAKNSVVAIINGLSTTQV